MPSKSLAQLIGPTLLAMAPSEVMNLHIWANNNPTVTYLNGVLLFIAGLSIVRVHNRWASSWPVLITLTGWAAILAGLFRMFAPEARQGGVNSPTFVVLAVIFTIGVVLTFKGFSRAAA